MPSSASACRLLDPPPNQADVLWVHLEGSCSEDEQKQFAITGEDLYRALEQGKSLDLHGVLIRGDVMLDRLPLQAVSSLSSVNDEIVSWLKQHGVQRVRVIPGRVVVRQSRFENVIATNLAQGALLVLGEVDFQKTRFEQSVDFSKMIFSAPFSFAKVKVGFEGFFIGAQFRGPVDFSSVTFGTHTRFHKAMFMDLVTFSETQFVGVAEFLEVEFRGDADFSGTLFLSGTGFSGSVFHGPLNFSHVQVEKEMYFRFSEFIQHVSFRDSDFNSVLDLSNTKFSGEKDFTGLQLTVFPTLEGSTLRPEDVPPPRRMVNWPQIGIMVVLIILGVTFLWFSRRTKPSSSA